MQLRIAFPKSRSRLGDGSVVRVVIIALALVFGWIALMMGSYAVSQLAADELDWLSEIDMALPGEPSSLLYGNRCVEGNTYGRSAHDQIFRCRAQGKSGEARRMTVMVHDSRVQRLIYDARDLQVGDLILQWGQYDSATLNNGDVHVLRWENGILATVTGGQRLTLLSPVETIMMH